MQKKRSSQKIDWKLVQNKLQVQKIGNASLVKWAEILKRVVEIKSGILMKPSKREELTKGYSQWYRDKKLE